MALSYIDYTGDGSTTDYTIPFNYLDQAHIHVYVVGLEVTNFTWLTATQIRLASAPANTNSIRIKRITPNAARLVSFQNGSALDAVADLSQDSNQLFYISQEMVDGGVSGTAATSNTFTANGTNTVFAMGSAPTAGSTPVVTVNGVTKVQGVDYTISGQTITFTSPPVAGAVILVTYTAAVSGGGGGGAGSSGTDPGSWTYDIFTGDGATPSFVLKAPPGNLAVLAVSVNGLTKLPGTDYLLSGQTVTFLTPPANGTSILIRYGATLPATAVSVVQEFRTATAAQTLFNLTSTYQPGTSTMLVYVNGLILIPGVDYTETSAASVTINIPLLLGDAVLFVYGNPINANTVDGARVINGTIDASTKLKAASVDLTRLSTTLQAQINTATNPTGKVDWFVMKAAPSGWLAADGGSIGNAASGATSRNNPDTQALFTALWTDWLNADLPIQDSTGTATTRGVSALADFNANKRLPLPDLRGEFVRGWDNTRGVDAGRNIGSFQADQIKSHVHTAGIVAGAGYGAGNTGASGNTGAFGGSETRPRNVALLACIKL